MSNEYRCTRPNAYPCGTVGYKDTTARCGHYIEADSEEAAHRRMKALYPTDSHFDVQLWAIPSKSFKNCMEVV